MTPTLLVGVIILAYALGRASDRNRAGQFLGLQRWQKLAGLAAVLLAVLIAISPEFFAFGILGDTALFDLLVLLISLQLQAVTVQVRCWLGGLATRARWWFMSPCMSYLLVLSLWAALDDLVSGIARFVHRTSS